MIDHITYLLSRIQINKDRDEALQELNIVINDLSLDEFRNISRNIQPAILIKCVSNSQNM